MECNHSLRRKTEKMRAIRVEKARVPSAEADQFLSAGVPRGACALLSGTA